MPFDGSRLREARKAVRLTQTELAEQAYVSRKSIERYEAGSVPNGTILERIVVATGKPVEWFFPGTSDPQITEPLAVAIESVAVVLQQVVADLRAGLPPRVKAAA